MMKHHLARYARVRRLVAAIGLLALIAAATEHSSVITPVLAQGRNEFDATPLQEGQCLAFGGTHRTRHVRTGAMRFVGTEPGRPLPPPSGLASRLTPEAAARAYLAVCGSLFGIADHASEVTVARTTRRDGRSSVRFQQVTHGIPILGGELIVQFDDAMNVLATTGRIQPKVPTQRGPGVSASAAARTALAAMAKVHDVPVDALSASPPQLWIYSPTLVGPEEGAPLLVWRTEVTPRDLLPIRELVLIDAARGAIQLHFNQIDSARQRQTYTTNNTTSLPGSLVCDESSPSCVGGDSHAAAAHLYAGDTYNYYLTNHGRDSINDAGMVIKSTVHYSSNYVNAFWNGVQMVYGDGAGFPLADDVVGHELTHGVTQYTSGLYYYYQSGAINESLSDVFGEFIDQTNGHGTDTPAVKWLVGEDIAGLGAIRSMSNPPAFNSPDKMTSAFYYTGANDNGGVHTNSGINNKAAFLMVDGGTFNGQTITGLGIPKVAAIYYEAQTHLLTSASDYGDLFDALFQACNNLAGTSGILTSDCQEVRKATLAVEMNQQPVAGFNPDAPICAAGQTPSTLFFDNLESGSSNFGFSAATGTTRWQFGSPSGLYAHSGTHALYASDYPDGVTDTSVAMVGGVTLPANAYLHFAHAYGFEAPAYDGGVVEYSANGGASWTDAGILFDSNGYKGVLSSSYGNPLGGRPAFVADSHGYISSRLNLSPLAGQNVRFRWRMGLDVGVYNKGWWLDDVRIYTCSSILPPGVPGSPVPADGTASVATTASLTWSATGATSYDVLFGTTNPPPAAATGLASPSYTPATLLPMTQYFWQVVARNAGGTTSGPVWSLTTGVPPELIVWDTFTASTGTMLLAHVPDFDRPGAIWTATGGTPVPMLSGGRVGVAAGSGHLQSTIASGVADIIMRADYRVGAGSQLGGLAFRLADADNHLLLLAVGPTLQFFRKQAGGYTLLGTANIPAASVGSTHRIELRATGSVLQGWWDNALALTVVEPFQQTATRHGLDWNSAYDPTGTFDNFEIRSVGLPPSAPGAPGTPAPADAATDVASTATLTWIATSAVSYDVAFGATNPPPTVATGLSSPTYTPPGLSATTQYYWQITARNAGGSTTGPVWRFTTDALPPDLLISDSFTGTPGTPLSAHAPDVNQPSATWVVTGATPVPTLIGGVVGVAAGSGHVQATLASSVSDIIIRTDYTVGAGPQLGGLAFRLTDANNHLVLLALGPTLQFFRKQAGVYTPIGTGGIPPVNAGSTHRLEVRAVGSTLQGWWDNALVLTVAEPFQQTATRHGLDWNSAYDSTVTFDNFEIRNAGAPAAPPGTPASASPADGGTNVATGATLTWTAANATTYDVNLGTANPPPSAALGLASASYTPTLTPATTYFWQVVAHSAGGTTTGPVWSFSTTATADLPIISDSFTAAPGTLLTAHAPDVNFPGSTWIVTGAMPVPTITGGRVGVAAGSGHLQSTIASGVSDIILRADYNVGGGPQLGGLAFRFTDADNHLLLLAVGPTLQFYRKQAGGYTPLGTAAIPAVNVGSTHRLEVHAEGSRLEGWWDNARVLTVVEAFQQTATRHGLDWNSAYDSTVTFDNFEIRSATGPVPAPGTPTVSAPADAATDVSTTATLTWSATSAVSYDVAFGTTNPPPMVATGLSSPTYTATALSATTQYHWQITARSAGGPTTGPVWRFTTGALPPDLLISDSFTGTIGTPLSAHAPDVNQPGATWIVTGATPMPTLAGGVVGVTPGTGHLQATLDSGVADLVIHADYKVGAGPQLGGLAFRLTDANNHLLLLAVGPTLQFFRKQAGVYTQIGIGTIPMVNSGSTHRLEVRAVGATLQGWWDNALVLTIAESFQQTATRHGLDWNSAYDSTVTFDSVEIRSVAGPAVTSTTRNSLSRADALRR